MKSKLKYKRLFIFHRIMYDYNCFDLPLIARQRVQQIARAEQMVQKDHYRFV